MGPPTAQRDTEIGFLGKEIQLHAEDLPARKFDA